jgi:hypothetical protein
MFSIEPRKRAAQAGVDDRDAQVGDRAFHHDVVVRPRAVVADRAAGHDEAVGRVHGERVDVVGDGECVVRQHAPVGLEAAVAMSTARARTRLRPSPRV